MTDANAKKRTKADPIADFRALWEEDAREAWELTRFRIVRVRHDPQYDRQYQPGVRAVRAKHKNELGMIRTYNDNHGLCYYVVFAGNGDDSVPYEPEELTDAENGGAEHAACPCGSALFEIIQRPHVEALRVFSYITVHCAQCGLEAGPYTACIPPADGSGPPERYGVAITFPSVKKPE